MENRDNSPGWKAISAQGIALLGAFVAVWLCGGYSQGSLGVFICCIGGTMILLPPRQNSSWLLWGLAIVLLACTSFSLAPASWVASPAWRQIIEACPLIPKSSMVTLVPRETIFWLGMLAASLIAGLYLLSQPVRSRSQLYLTTICACGCAVYAGLAIYAQETGWQATFDGDTTFGFFPNRNHTALFLVTGCILGLGVVLTGLRNKHPIPAILAAIAVGVCAFGLISFSISRAGVLLLGTGTLLWAGGLGRRFWTKPMAVSFSVLAAASVLFLVLVPSAARDRLMKSVAWTSPASPLGVEQQPAVEIPNEFRIRIYQDTWRMIKDFPITGVGLGAYSYVYPQYAKDSLVNAGALHPESDWLMIVAECGFLALLVALLTAGYLLWSLRGRQSHPYWPLKWALMCVVLIALLHGIIDVPLHRVELGWWILVLGCLGLSKELPSSEISSAARRVQHGAFILSGLALLLLGGSLVRAEWFQGKPLPPFAGKQAEKDLMALYTAEQHDKALAGVAPAILASPMNHGLYYLGGVFNLYFEGTDQQVDDYFAAERLLDPGWPAISVTQGMAWLPVDAKRSSALWMNAVKLQSEIDKTTGKPIADGFDLYQLLLYRGEKYPDTINSMEPAADSSPRLWLRWLIAAPSSSAVLPSITQNELFLKSLNAGEQKQLLNIWYSKGDKSALWSFLDTRPDWAEAGWPALIRRDLEEGRYQEAVSKVSHRYQVSLDLPAPDPQTLSESIPDDPIAATGWLLAKNNQVSARRILDEATKNGGPQLAEIHRLRAALAAKEGDWRRAWSALQASLQASGQKDIL